MTSFSVVIPVYNCARYCSQCIESVLPQLTGDDEIIVVDDASSDNTVSILQALSSQDSRIRLILHSDNRGTLRSRRDGVLASTGDYVMLVDQDDEIASNSLNQLRQYAAGNEFDIIHFGVHVVPENSAAQKAADGMEGFLCPTPREIHGQDILRLQFASEYGFDWHVHHKLFRGELLRRAYSVSADTYLVLSDDLYMNFIIDSFAESYLAVPHARWYLYHLGRGDTFGQPLTRESMAKLAQRDATALRLIREFVSTNQQSIPRNDWNSRLADVRDRLGEHVMNEWKDNLPSSLQSNALDDIRHALSDDVICAVLYRYVRDFAYDYLQHPQDQALQQYDRTKALRYLGYVQQIAREETPDSGNRHYTQLRDTALGHLHEPGGILAQQHNPSTGFFSRISQLFRNSRFSKPRRQ